MIFVENLTISRKGLPLLKELSFHIKPGESVALMGLNGTGKSTLLKTLLGLHLDYEGAATLMGQSIDKPLARENITYLPERFSINSSLTGEHYLDFFVNHYENIVIELDFPQDALPQKIKTYSKGMLQKLGLIHFFAQQKALKIADEIMSGLDFKTRRSVQKLLQQQQAHGTTFLFTTHTFQDALEAATRLLYIDNKTISFDGNPHIWCEKNIA